MKYTFDSSDGKTHLYETLGEAIKAAKLDPARFTYIYTCIVREDGKIIRDINNIVYALAG